MLSVLSNSAVLINSPSRKLDGFDSNAMKYPTLILNEGYGTYA